MTRNTSARLVIAVLGIALAASACSGEPDAEVSPSVSASPSASPSASVTASPEPSPPSAEPTPAPSASAGVPASPEPDPNEQDDDVARDDEAPAPPRGSDSQPTEVSVRPTNWGADGADFTAGAVVDVVTEDGQCTMTLTSGSRTLEATGPAARSAASTSCGEGLAVPLREVEGRTWSMRISFQAPGYTGASDAVEVQNR